MLRFDSIRGLTFRLSCSCMAVARAWGASASPLPAMSAKDVIKASVRSQLPIKSWRYGPKRLPANLLPSPTIPLIAACPEEETQVKGYLHSFCIEKKVVYAISTNQKKIMWCIFIIWIDFCRKHQDGSGQITMLHHSLSHSAPRGKHRG